ncbi:nitrile-specifier protein 5 isoform X2 [Phalaenopsis equestris]|uniref:nitrile-specifier protein 5 isoform X2 n=1 Tax=Phalaenopsis equestris TaxID=78828 RepID=UPI0009E2D667|nr:nitrile-specifier protein 5 isoform X2 [Phalaenopsis equestris]
MEGKWVKLEQKGESPGARSSHAVAVVRNKAYVFGGEITPRVPVDNKLHVFDLGQHVWSSPEVSGDIPLPRVGVTMTAVGNIIYVFGGRDADHKELNELLSFDTRTNQWSLLSSNEMGPPHRSYHSMTADNRRIYIFGGCGNAGRLNDLWAYDTEGHEWIQFPSPGERCRPRGGPGLAVSSGKVWVVYGFSGEELDDVHSFDLTNKEWSTIETRGDEKPSPRSVFSTVSIGKYVFIHGGEIDPSDLGHLGAGKFAGEVYVLDTETCAWIRVCDGGESPGRRGWCAFSATEIGGEKGLLVYGGNSPTNDRLHDMFFFVPRL